MKETIGTKFWFKMFCHANRCALRAVNDRRNTSNIGLTFEQVKKLCEYIKSKEYGSYRTLIYGELGQEVAYVDGMYMGLFDLNNWLIENVEEKGAKK